MSCSWSGQGANYIVMVSAARQVDESFHPFLMGAKSFVRRTNLGILVSLLLMVILMLRLFVFLRNFRNVFHHFLVLSTSIRSHG